MQYHYSLLPVARPAVMPPTPSRLTSIVSRPDIKNLYTVKLLDSISDLDLVSILVDLKRICVSRIRKMHPLFGNKGLNYYVIVVHNKNLPINCYFLLY